MSQEAKINKLILKISALILFLLAGSLIVFGETNVSLNYVWNSSCPGTYCWIPWLATSDGRPKMDINLLKSLSSISSFI